MSNLTIFTEFVLMQSSSSRELQVMQGLLFLVIYLGALTGNLVTVTVIVTDPHLHSQMYFIGNLSLIDICCISITVPKFIVNSLTGSALISLPACAAQLFLFNFFAATELAFLVVMSYDRYVAISHPLHYGLTITPRLCAQAAGVSRATGLGYSAVHTGIMFRLPFTGSNVIHQYFCDIPQILSISSSDVCFSEFVFIALSIGLGLLCSILLLISYINIFSMVLNMHSMEARNKALSTCTPHLAVLFIFIVSGIVANLGPIPDKTYLSNLLIGMFYSMVPPLIKPLIYSLRNKEIDTALCRMFNRCF
ncbi:olfactory receptor 14I1-like [Dasypus novemcinctus]|uniref:olfactory receptor 14I1-like n=1 Tax=Dasypus novemcinctus TaxID=9361 RepID=UPI0039C9AC08